MKRANVTSTLLTLLRASHCIAAVQQVIVIYACTGAMLYFDFGQRTSYCFLLRPCHITISIQVVLLKPVIEAGASDVNLSSHDKRHEKKSNFNIPSLEEFS